MTLQCMMFMSNGLYALSTAGLSQARSPVTCSPDFHRAASMSLPKIMISDRGSMAMDQTSNQPGWLEQM